MIADQVFVCGTGVLSHPVTYLFHLPSGAAHGAPNASILGDRSLVLADCRLNAAQDIAAWVGEGLAQKRPVLLLCPSVDTLAALKGRVGILPHAAGAALLIAARQNSSGLMNFEVSTLEYTAAAGNEQSLGGPAAAAKGGQAPKGHDSQIECACTDFATLGTMFVQAEAVDAFKIRVERAMEGKFASVGAEPTPPTGLKYFLQVINQSIPFTYSGSGVSNGAGALTLTWTVWGFLSQSQQSNAQYLSVEGQLSLAPGSLHADNQCDRGYGNGYLKATLTAPLNYTASVPTSGDGTFSGTVSIPISYKSPLGGYQIWNYSSSVNNTVSSWSCRSLSSGNALGAMWWMNSPCNGSNINDTWRDAFTFWGHVNGFTGASSGSLGVNTVFAWNTSTLLTGYQNIGTSFEWEGARFYGSSCSPGVYWYINAPYGIWSNQTGFSVDFTSINP